MSDTDDLNAWLTDPETHERVLDIKRRVKPHDVPYYLLLFLMDLHDIELVETDPDEDDDAEPWKS